MEQKDNKKNDDLASQVLENLKHPPVEVINPNNASSNTKKYVLIALALLALVVAGFALWKFILSDNKSNDQATPTTTGDKAEQLPENDLSQEYVSDRLMIDINHPSDWRVDESSGEIIIYSPAKELEAVNGETLAAEFRVIVKQGAGETDSEYLGRGFAVNKSSIVKYTDPTSNQREESFVTNFGLDSSTYFSYFVLQGNFKLDKNETLGKDFAGEADEILVSGGFYSSESDDKTQLVSLDPAVLKTDKTYETAIEIVKSLRLR